MNVFWYTLNGMRAPFNPGAICEQFAGCLICGSRATVAGILIPHTEAMVAMVLRLRRHPARPGSTPALGYALCRTCSEDPHIEYRVETAFIEAAAKVRVQ